MTLKFKSQYGVIPYKRIENLGSPIHSNLVSEEPVSEVSEGAMTTVNEYPSLLVIEMD